MKNFGNRIGFPNNNNVSDAREFLRAKRKDEHNTSRGTFASNITPKSNINFTIPIKTFSNDIFIKKKVEIPNIDYRRPYEPPMTTNRSGTRMFTDPKVSQGIFSHSAARTDHVTRPIEPRVIPKRITTDCADTRPSLKTQRVSEDIDTVKFTIVNEERAVARPPIATPRLTAPKSLISPIQGYRIEVKNLHPQVNVDDVYELFTSLNGDLRSCNLVRPGYAEVVFRTLNDAQKSIEEFHGRELDGRPMHLNLVTSAQEPSVQNVNTEIQARIAKIQSNRTPTANVLINKDAIFRSMYIKSADVQRMSKKPFKFSVTL